MKAAMLELDSKAPIQPRLRRYGGRVTNQDDNLLVCFDKLTGYHWLAQEGTHKDLLTWKGGISLKTLLILICILDFRNIKCTFMNTSAALQEIALCNLNNHQ